MVGAGLAGLVSALRLQEAGNDVTVLEARDRVGGRVLTLRDGLAGGQYADVGAEIIYHGQDEIVRLCERFDLALTPRMSLEAELPNLFFDGRRLDRADTARVVAELRELYARCPPAEFESAAAWAGRTRVGRRTRLLMDAMAQGTPVLPLRYVDAREFNPQLGWGKGYRKIVGGNDQLPRRIAGELDVRLGRAVRTVGWDDGSVSVETDGETYRGDVAVVAVPGPLTTELGFDPPLPVEKLRALHSLRYGSGARLAVQYAERDRIRAGMGASTFTDQLPRWCFDQSLHQPGPGIVVSSILGGEHEPRLLDPEGALAEADRTMELISGGPVTRTFGVVVSWSDDPWARCVVRAPVGDQRETLLPLLRAPLGGRVFFAGEHVDDRVGPGGMEGAIRSALGVAADIL